MTMTKGEMLTKLYEALVKNLRLGVIGIENNDVAETNLHLQKAQSIINYLVSTLDRKYPIAGNLMSLYDFFNRQIIAANVKKDAGMINEIIPLIEELKVTFIEADRRARADMAHHAAASSGISAMG